MHIFDVNFMHIFDVKFPKKICKLDSMCKNFFIIKTIVKMQSRRQHLKVEVIPVMIFVKGN